MKTLVTILESRYMPPQSAQQKLKAAGFKPLMDGGRYMDLWAKEVARWNHLTPYYVAIRFWPAHSGEPDRYEWLTGYVALDSDGETTGNAFYSMEEDEDNWWSEDLEVAIKKAKKWEGKEAPDPSDLA